jgi:hypothetical protein
MGRKTKYSTLPQKKSKYWEDGNAPQIDLIFQWNLYLYHS